MAIGAPTGPGAEKPDFQVERRLSDRAVFHGDTGRIQTKETDSNKKAFQKTLSSKLKGDDEDADSDSEEVGEAAAQPNKEAVAEEIKDNTAQKNEEADKMSREGAQDEAEKMGGGGLPWKGPSPLLALAMMPGAPGIIAAQVEHHGRPEGGKRAKALEEITEEEARVTPAVLQGLREAGMRDPLTGLQDPRLRGEKPDLSVEQGWRQESLAGGTLYTWQLLHVSTYQRLHWVDGDAMLESSAGNVRHVLQKKNGQFFSKVSRQEGQAFKLKP